MFKNIISQGLRKGKERVGERKKEARRTSLYHYGVTGFICRISHRLVRPRHAHQPEPVDLRVRKGSVRIALQSRVFSSCLQR